MKIFKSFSYVKIIVIHHIDKMIDFFEAIKISLFIFGFLDLTVSFYWPGICYVDKLALSS